jgi:hypothetical protein
VVSWSVRAAPTGSVSAAHSLAIGVLPVRKTRDGRWEGPGYASSTLPQVGRDALRTVSLRLVTSAVRYVGQHLRRSLVCVGIPNILWLAPASSRAPNRRDSTAIRARPGTGRSLGRPHRSGTPCSAAAAAICSASSMATGNHR